VSESEANDGDGEGEGEAEDVEYEAGDANTVRGATVARVLEYLAKQLVDEPEGVVIDSTDRGHSVTYSITVAPDDMGKIIGKRGRVVQSIRTVVRAAGAREGIEVNVDVVDD
jgi:predicted RNA-binding protein YlqC (UPF0109 family)